MIQLKQSVFNKIIEQARKELPNEACGYFAGKDNIITKHYELTNIDHSPEHYTLDPKEQFAALKAAREEGLTIIANYHSHPETPARMSKEDIRLAYDPDIYYFILSLAEEEPEIKAFKVLNGEVIHHEIEMTDE